MLEIYYMYQLNFKKRDESSIILFGPKLYFLIRNKFKVL